MDYKGRKVWVFGAIPVVYSSNEKDWAIDTVKPRVSAFLSKLLIKSLKAYAWLGLDVPVSPRKVKVVKKSPDRGHPHSNASVSL